jgi:hypothetical protein
MKTTVKKIFFIISLSVFIVPLVETQFRFFHLDSLKGAYTRKNKPLFTDSTWFNGKFQSPYEEYINDTVGFRSLLVKFSNQLDYSFFNKLHAYDIVVGKNNSLQATTHYDAYLGKLNIPYRSIDSLSNKLKLLQDTLSKKNISLIFVFAPSKGSFAISEAPYSYDTTRKNLSWYSQYLSAFNKKGITYFDFNRYYLDAKNRTPYPLYTKYGIHWSYVSCAYAFDTLCRFINQKRNIILPSVKFKNPIAADKPYKEVDIDLTPSLNLLFPIKFDEKFWMPDFIVNADSSSAKVNALFVTDSYFWNITSLGLHDEIFNHCSFWYYNDTGYEKNNPGSFLVSSRDIGKEIEKHQVIVIMATFTNLDNPGWGFIDRAYNHYFPAEDKKLKEIIAQIKSNEGWLESVRKKAIINGNSLDKQIYEDAVYLYNKNKN